MTQRQMFLLFTLYLDMEDGGEGLKLSIPAPQYASLNGQIPIEPPVTLRLPDKHNPHQ